MSKLSKKLNTNIIENVIEKNILMNENNYETINNDDDNNNNLTIIDSINILNSSSEIDNYDDKINYANFITSKSLVQKNINNFNKPRLILKKNNNNNNNNYNNNIYNNNNYNLKNKIQNINKKIHKLEKIIIIFNNNSVLESLLFPKILV